MPYIPNPLLDMSGVPAIGCALPGAVNNIAFTIVGLVLTVIL